MSTVSAGTKIACRVDVPEPYASRSRFALEALLVPMGLEPVWSGTPRIVYGRAEDAAYGTDVVRLAYAPAAAAYFGSRRRPYDPSLLSAIEFQGEEWPALFATDDGNADLVASTFLLLSGWHEAAVSTRDEHGRVPYEATLPGLLNEPDRPVVDAYRTVLAARLSSGGIPVQQRAWAGRSWAFCPTHDVDYLRKSRPGIWYRELVDHLILNRRRDPASKRISRFVGYLRQMASGDPYRAAFTRMIDEVADLDGTATYFLKAGAEDPHDVPYSLSDSFLRRQLDELQTRAFEVALHPSYRSVDDPEMLKKERDRLRAAARTELRSVRQHYLRYNPASTPSLHAKTGFKIDSTIGFADRPGFRRGTCLPHRAYDLNNDAALDVWEMPLIVMESALFNRQGMAIDEAVGCTLELMSTCRHFGGVCVVLWHNTLWDELDCPGWGEHFTRTLHRAVQEEALMTSLEGALQVWR